MKKAAIVYSQFFNRAGTARALGGVETYLLYLGRLLIRLGYEVVLYQSADVGFEIYQDGIKVVGVPQINMSNKGLYAKALSEVEGCGGLLIFGADQHSVKTNYPYSINIMHGIAWDLPAELISRAGGRYGLLGKIPRFGKLFAKHLLGYNRLRQIDNTKYSVLVDYNSINWYRTQVDTTISSDYRVILNFVDLPSTYSPCLERHDDDVVKILFARRFHKFRGSEIMVAAAKKILAIRDNVEVVFAGEGPEESVIREAFEGERRVKITSYLPENSISFHEDYHIAVVPSVASEGSSLSLAEAMGAGCAVIASDVGGMTNMVVDGFNGCLIKPDANSLFQKMLYLIDNVEVRKVLARRATETASTALSLSKWEAEWKSVIDLAHANNDTSSIRGDI